MFNVEHGGTVRADACGNVKWRLPLGPHHSIDRAANGSFWISNLSLSPHTSSPAFPDGHPGLDALAYPDRMAHASEDGKLLGNLNVLDIMYGSDLQRYISKAYLSANVGSLTALVPSSAGPDPSEQR